MTVADVNALSTAAISFWAICAAFRILIGFIR